MESLELVFLDEDFEEQSVEEIIEACEHMLIDEDVEAMELMEPGQAIRHLIRVLPEYGHRIGTAEFLLLHGIGTCIDAKFNATE